MSRAGTGRTADTYGLILFYYRFASVPKRKCAKNRRMNPLLEKPKNTFGALEFNLVKNEHYLPAIKAEIEKAHSILKKLKTGVATWQWFEELEAINEDLDRVSSCFFNLLGANSNDEMQTLAREIGPILSSFGNDILLDEDIFKRIKELYDKQDSLSLNPEQKQLLKKTYLDFKRNGALLSSDDKAKLRKLDEQLAELKPRFGENTLKATNAFELHVTDKSDLEGLPQNVIDGAAAFAKEKKKDGWIFTLHGPVFLPFMKFSAKRELREKMFRAGSSKNFRDSFNNEEIIKDIATLMHKRAQLLGYETYAHYALENRMAETPQKVDSFLNRLYDVSYKAAKKDIAEVQAFASTEGGPNPLMPWDFLYYAEKLQTKKFDLDEEKLRPYFALDKVVDGVFACAKKLYDLEFKLNDSLPKYHEDVKVYEVYKSGTQKLIGLFYTDFFPRPSKREGAWMTNFREQGLYHGEVRRPHVAIVCNFTKPTATQPSLLSLQEVTTLFHEFGHALHGLLSQCHYRSLAGTNVYWDFVELPSQIMENWVFEEEGLKLFAKHYQTGEAIPHEWVKKIKDSNRFLAGYWSLRQVNFAMLDMAWFAMDHVKDPSQIKDVEKFEKSVTDKCQILPRVEGTNGSCSFGHIFGGGYSAGYYSYKWAEVLDADAFELFKDKGVFNQEVAKSFEENILSRGGTEHPMILYKKFRGREPDPAALFRREGLEQ